MVHTRMRLHVLSVSAAVLFLGPTAFAQSQADTTFVKTAIEVNVAEIQIGRLATQKGATEGVKKFGQRMITDHTRLEDGMKPIAAKIGLTPPTELAPDDQALLTKLQGESGAEFDSTYVHAMVDGHRKVLQLYKTEAASGQDSAVKSAAAKGEPTIAEHLRLAEHLLSAMGNS